MTINPIDIPYITVEDLTADDRRLDETQRELAALRGRIVTLEGHVAALIQLVPGLSEGVTASNVLARRSLELLSRAAPLPPVGAAAAALPPAAALLPPGVVIARAAAAFRAAAAALPAAPVPLVGAVSSAPPHSLEENELKKLNDLLPRLSCPAGTQRILRVIMTVLLKERDCGLTEVGTDYRDIPLSLLSDALKSAGYTIDDKSPPKILRLLSEIRKGTIPDTLQLKNFLMHCVRERAASVATTGSKRPAEEELNGASAPKAARKEEDSESSSEDSSPLDVLCEAARHLASSSSHAAAPAALRAPSDEEDSTEEEEAPPLRTVGSTLAQIEDIPAEQTALNTLLQEIPFVTEKSTYLHRLVMTMLLRQKDCGLTRGPVRYRMIPTDLFTKEAKSQGMSLSTTDSTDIQAILSYIRTGRTPAVKVGAYYPQLRAFLEDCLQNRRKS